MADQALRLILLGRFELTADGVPIIDARWPHHRAAAVLKSLGLAHQHALHREELMDRLWPELMFSGAADQLYKSLHWLRAVARKRGFDESFISIASQVVRLDLAVEVDVDRFRAATRYALRVPTDLDAVTDALAAYGGPLLPDDRLEEWTMGPHDELQQLWRSLAGAQASLLATLGDQEAAMAGWSQILEHEPSDEIAHRRLMEGYLAAGRRDAALRQYHACRQMLMRELGVEPEPETETLARRILEGQIAAIPSHDEQSGERILLLEQLADVRRRTGDVAGSAELYSRALELAEASLGPTSADGETMLRLQSKAALTRILQGDLSGGATLIGHIQRSLAAEMPAYVTARTYLLLSQLRWHSGRFSEALDAAERAVAATRESPAAERAHALEMLALACHALGDWRRGLDAEMARQALDLGDGFDVDEAFEGHPCLWEYHLYGDRPYPKVEATVHAALRDAERAGNRRAMSVSCLALGTVQFLTGRWTDSGETLERGIGLAESVDAEQATIHGQQRLALLETSMGRLDSAQRRLAAMIERAESSPSAQVRHHSRTRLYACLARNRLQAGAIDAAVGAVRTGLATRDEVGACLTCDALLYPVSVPVGLAAGLMDMATSGVTAATVSGAQFESGAWRAAAAHARGLLALAEADMATAGGELDDAARTFATLGQPYDEARSLEALALVLRGARGRPHSAVRKAETIYRSLGAAPDSDQLASIDSRRKVQGRSRS